MLSKNTLPQIACCKAWEEVLLTFREVALGLPGKVPDAVSTHTEEDRVAVYEIINGEVYEMLTILSTGDLIAPRRTKTEQRRLAKVARGEAVA